MANDISPGPSFRSVASTTEAPLSYSSVRAYLECPQRWKFLYVDGLKEAPKGYFSFGRTVHEVLEALLRPLAESPGPPAGPPRGRQRTLDAFPGGAAKLPGQLMPLETLLEAYRGAWVSEGYTSAEEEERYRRLGAEILSSYWRLLSSALPRPVAVEQHLEATWDGIRVHGYIDRLDRTDAGGLEIVDYKTSRELSEEDARESDQLGLYQVLVERNFREPVEALTLYHLRQLRPLSVPPKGPDALSSLFDRVGSARDGIRSRSFEPAPGRHCPRCEFQSLCPEFRGVPESERAHLADLVDRFARLREEEGRLETELRSAAAELHEAADRLKVHRIPGTGRVARRKPEATWEFPDEWLRPLLEEHGLTGRMAPDDPAAAGRLLKDRSVPPEVRARLAGAGGRRIRWYWELERPAPDD